MLQKFLKFLIPILFLFPFFASAQTTNCTWIGNSMTCFTDNTLNNLEQQNQQLQQQLNQQRQQAQQRQAQQFQIQQNCINSGMFFSNGQCISPNTLCQQNYGPYSQYQSKDNSSKVVCGCLSGYEFNPARTFCVIKINYPVQTQNSPTAAGGGSCVQGQIVFQGKCQTPTAICQNLYGKLSLEGPQNPIGQQLASDDDRYAINCSCTGGAVPIANQTSCVIKSASKPSTTAPSKNKPEILGQSTNSPDVVSNSYNNAVPAAAQPVTQSKPGFFQKIWNFFRGLF